VTVETRFWAAGFSVPAWLTLTTEAWAGGGAAVVAVAVVFVGTWVASGAGAATVAGVGCATTDGCTGFFAASFGAGTALTLVFVNVVGAALLVCT